MQHPNIASQQDGQAESYWLLGDHYTFKISSEETMGSLAVVEHIAFPQNGPPPHIHHREDESFYVLEGTLSVLLRDRYVEAHVGDFLHVPKGTLHTYKNIGEKPSRMLVILTPGGFENLWRELGEPAKQNSTPPTPLKGSIEKLIAAAPKYHLEIPPPK